MSSTSRTTNRRRPDPPPQRTPFLRRRTTRFVGLGLVLAIVAGAVGIFYLTRGASDVTVSQAVQDYRSSSAEAKAPEASTPVAAQKTTPTTKSASVRTKERAQTAARPAGNAFVMPKPGVYTYATQGYEQTDALAGQRHDYPKETTITDRAAGCGWTSRWQPSGERWESSEICERPAGSEMKRYTMYHEFFRRGSREDFACPGGFVQKPNVTSGQTWNFACRSDRSTATSKVTVVGFEQIRVGGQSVRAVHIRYEITVKGADHGTLIQDRWLGLRPPFVGSHDADGESHHRPRSARSATKNHCAWT